MFILLHCSWLQRRVSAVECLPVLHHNVDYISFPWAPCGIFQNRVLLMYTLEGVSSVTNFIIAYEESQ